MNTVENPFGDPGFADAHPGLRLLLVLLDSRDVVCHRPEPAPPIVDDDDEDEDEDEDDRGSSGGNIDPDDDEGDFDDDDDDEDETLWTAGSRKAMTGDGYR
jgi:hypothetical protein